MGKKKTGQSNEQGPFSVGEFAKLVGVSVKTLQRWDRDGSFAARHTPGGHRYYTAEDYKRYLTGKFENN